MTGSQALASGIAMAGAGVVAVVMAVAMSVQ